MTKRIRTLIVPCIALLSVLGTLLPGILSLNTPVHAATSSVDPLVAIAVDATKQGCVETFIANLHTPQQSITQIPCPDGTIIRSIRIPRSQAEAQHEAYIVLPSSQASQTVWRQVYQQIQQLMEAKGQTLLQSSKQKKGHPLTACGSSGSAGILWSPWSNTTYYSTEQFFKTSDCKHVDLEVASIKVYPNPQEYLNWSYDLYAGGNFGVPGCPSLVGGTYSHSVDQLWPPGYYYENWVFFETCDPGGDAWYNNIGPIN